MIHIAADPHDRMTTEIVVRAFERSFTRGQITEHQNGLDVSGRNTVLVAINPDEYMANSLREVVSDGGKVILFGRLSEAIGDVAGVDLVAVDRTLIPTSGCEQTPAGEMRVSPAALVYSDSVLGLSSPVRRRHFCRYDFLNEWNNLGYGRMGFGDGRWDIAQIANSAAAAVAVIEIDGGPPIGAAVTVRDFPRGSLLWFARPVGPVDGQDWAVVENFVATYRAEELTCRPCLKGIPHGYGAAVSMRLDCDEDVASARPLFELYSSRRRPVSLAIVTGRLRSRDLALIDDVMKAGGAILSHSVTHLPHWGGSGDAAEREAQDSKGHLEECFPDLLVRYAVSPFHQNPIYVPDALARAGYNGFIGGSISAEPEFFMARAGVPPFTSYKIVSHSQSCMLHGDCLLSSEEDPIAIFKEAFWLAKASREFFGYLDHPFSERYAYGWQSEAARLDTHAAYLSYLESECGNEPLLFVNEDTCMEFIREKAEAVIVYDPSARSFRSSRQEAGGLPLSIDYRGKLLRAGP